MDIASVCLGTALMASQDGFYGRTKDWRFGPVVYQVFVDRFAPSADLEKKSGLYGAPRVLKTWNDVPKPGRRLPAQGLYSHELEFWGGDIPSLASKLAYVQSLKADVVYLLPVHQSLTNHRYDAQDHGKVAPEYGTEADFRRLVARLHKAGMRLVVDGVFNHIGRTSALFQKASKDPTSRYRDWFFFGSEYPAGYRGWAGVPNLPALRLENPQVQSYLWKGKDSIVRKYLAMGADGWRLDVAFELGPKLLSSLAKSAHAAKPGSLVVGEILGYPSEWFPAVDGVCDFFSTRVAMDMIAGRVSGARAGRMLEDRVADAGLDNTLRSWLQLDNHDTPRVADQMPVWEDRRLLMALHMTLPGSPVVYYGSELGMTGNGDPMNRAPMRWDMVTAKNPDLGWTRKLAELRRAKPALRYGDFRVLETDRLLAFARTGERVMDTAIVVVNPTTEVVTETFATRVGRLMSWGALKDVLSGSTDRSVNGLMNVSMPAKSIRVYAPVSDTSNGYSPYDRVDR